MQFGFAPSAQRLFFVILLLSPLSIYLERVVAVDAVVQAANGTLPNTPLVDVSLNNCPRHFYLPMIPGIGVHQRQLASAGAAAQSPIPNQFVADDQPFIAPPLSAALARRLDEVPIITSTIVFTEATSLWAAPSPDPSGIDRFGPGRIIVSDSEVNEHLDSVTNIWIFDLASRQVQTTTSTLINAISSEPTDIAVAEDGTIIITDDVRRQIIATHLDADGTLTKRHAFNSTSYGSTDPEGVDLFTTANNERYLVTADAAGNTIYIHNQGTNGTFDGPCSPGDDAVQKFDTTQLGFFQPAGVYAVANTVGEGVTYYLVGETDRDYIYVVHANAGSVELVQKIDIGELDKYKKMAGIVVMENGQIVLVFRGVDNDSNPDENDGVLAVIEPAT